MTFTVSQVHFRALCEGYMFAHPSHARRVRGVSSLGVSPLPSTQPFRRSSQTGSVKDTSACSSMPFVRGRTFTDIPPRRPAPAAAALRTGGGEGTGGGLRLGWPRLGKHFGVACGWGFGGRKNRRSDWSGKRAASLATVVRKRRESFRETSTLDICGAKLGANVCQITHFLNRIMFF